MVLLVIITTYDVGLLWQLLCHHPIFTSAVLGHLHGLSVFVCLCGEFVLLLFVDVESYLSSLDEGYCG